MNVLAHRIERQSQRQVETSVGEALKRAQAATEKAKREMRLITTTLASALNSELDHLPNSQAIAKAAILPDEIAQRIAVLGQEIDEMAFLAINELKKEAGDE
jgi:hypothetical protein